MINIPNLKGAEYNSKFKKMAKDTLIYGKRCRWYNQGRAWVSDDGTLAVVPDKNNKWNQSGKKKITIRTDHRGKKVATHPYGHVISIERAVVICFCPPHPSDGKAYMVNHKDGNTANCHYLNLEWVLYHYHHATTDSVKLDGYDKVLEVGKDGSVKIGGKKATIYDSFYDADVDLEVCSKSPFVYVPQKGSIYNSRVFIDDLMAKAGYVQGDDADMKLPVILHKDNDYMNCSSDNLEWVESTSDRYKAFLEQRRKDGHERVVKLNPGKAIPDNF